MNKILLFLFVLLVLSACGPAQAAPITTPLPSATVTQTPTVQPTSAIAAKRALFVIFSQFEENEYGIPRAILEEQGILVSVASSGSRSVAGHLGKKVQPDIVLSEVTTADYDAVVFIGGYGYQRSNVEAIRIAQEAVAQGKIVAAICIAPITLINAGVLKGKRATTSLPGSVIEQGGGIYTGASVERDGLIITGNGPGASRKFGEAIAAALAESASLPATVTPTLSPPESRASGLIAFASDLDGDFEIWLMNVSGSDQRKLTDNDALDISPAWSPDGKQVAFISNRDGNDEIYSMNADGSDVRRLTNTPDASESFPAWSPDGQFISFDSDRGGNWDVYTVNSDGSNLQRLTDHPGEDWISSWSPDGRQIAFESKRDGNYEIYVMNADGSNQQRLTQNAIQDGAPKWSPDGLQIAFFSRRDGNVEIYVMDAAGGNLHRLTEQAGDDSFPSWSPDGSQIVFSSGRHGNDEIYVMNSDGSNPHPLTDNGAQNWSPAWRSLP